MGLADPAVDSETGVAHDPDDGRRHVEQPWIRVGVDADPVDGRVTESHGNRVTPSAGTAHRVPQGGY